MALDPRRRIPRTDALLADERFVAARQHHSHEAVKAAIASAQAQARDGRISPEDVADRALLALAGSATTLRPIMNATGVVVHTNIGRAPLSDAAKEALITASGYVDVEFDPTTAKRAPRGRGALTALLNQVPDAGGALIVNNGAAALLLACLSVAKGGEILISRGELVEIGDGFRLPEMLAAGGVRLREVGTTNRTHLRDYEAAAGEAAAILKVHTSNYRVEGFAGVPSVAELATVGLPVIADVGSGLLRGEKVIPDEPDAGSWLRDGALLVTASGDKLLGGPQAGLVLGDADAVEQVRRHPLARAMRADKLALAAMEATLNGPVPPVLRALRETPDSLRERTESLAQTLNEHGLATQVVDAVGRVGGGGAPGFELPSLALALPSELALPLRTGEPCVVARTASGQCLVDLRCIPQEQDSALEAAILAAARTAEIPTDSGQLDPRGKE